MVFNSSIFLVFFLLFFPIYWAINKSFTIPIRNLFIIVCSYVFYGWWDWRFLSLIFISSITDYLIGLELAKTNKPSRRKILIVVSLVVNLGILAFFKYYNFFIDSAVEVFNILGFSWSTTSLNIILPVGISFYTFQTLSYTLDIYKSRLKPTKDLLAFFAFVSFFPQLVAGPIERARNLLPQFSIAKKLEYQMVVSGFRLALWGFFKKLVIADNFGLLADNLFSQDHYNVWITLFAALCFAIQIYADFSAYSDIAIGIAKTLGFKLSTNFRAPYFSKSYTEFWQRWHISLSTWFRDYVYIPLGGNRTTKSRMRMNIFITFLLSGLWHGANFTFILWGALHGLLLIIEKRFNAFLRGPLYAIAVFIGVVLLWLVFRAEDFNQLKSMTYSLTQFASYSDSGIPAIIHNFSNVKFVVLSLVMVPFFLVEYRIKDSHIEDHMAKYSKWIRWSIYYLLIVLILMLTNLDVKPSFIYFQF
ncbi:MAG: MBOAT family protein [Bacteroidia bacterium]